MLTSDLLPLLDGVNGVRLELKLLGTAELPVQNDDDEDGQYDWDNNTDNQPDAAALSLSWRDRDCLHSWKQNEKDQTLSI